MIQTVVNAIDANIKSKITSNIKCYGLCSEVERESQESGVNRYLINSEGNAAVADDNFEIGSAHVLNLATNEYRNSNFNISEATEMQLLIWITAEQFNQYDVYSLFRSVIFATDVKHDIAKNIQLVVTRANFKSTEIFRNNYNYFRGNKTTSNAPMNIAYISITYNILAQYANNKLNCINCISPCNGSIN